MLLVSTADDDIIANQNESRFQISVPITPYTTPQKSPPTMNEVPEPMEPFFSKVLPEEFKVAGTKPDTSNIDSESDTSNTSWTPVYNIEVFLQDYQLNIIKQEGDGNCLFRCIAAHIFGDSTRHNTIRRSIVDHIRRNRSNYEVFFPDGVDRNINEHLRRMSMNRTWGGEHEIQAARELYSMEIAILDSNQLGKYGGSFTSKTSCKLLFSNGNHYDLLVVNESESDTLENKSIDKDENHTDESQIPTPTSDIFPDSEHATA
jgi:hypothetical protein